MKKVIVAFIALGVCTAVVQAGFTTINAPAFGELGHEQIFEGIYGQNFSASGLDFVGSTITATRVEDTGYGSILNIVNPNLANTDDEVFDDGFVQAEASAKYSVLPWQEIGFFAGANGNNYTKLFDVGGYGFGATGSTGLLAAQGATWRWGHSRPRFGPDRRSSYRFDNPGNRDFMVSYQITGLNDGWTTWMFFWEDFSSSYGDFNDVAVQVRAASVANPVPAPGAVVLGMLGLPLVGWIKRRYAA
jgi:hypothetical protein